MYWKRIGNGLIDIGAIQVHFGSKTGIPKMLQIRKIRSYYTYFSYNSIKPY